MAQELKNRNEMDPRWQWRLDHIFETEEAFEAGMEAAKKDIENMKTWQGRVHENPRQAIRDSYAGSLKIEKLMAYASMHKDEDGGDPVRQARAAKVQSLIVAASSASAFLDPELLALPEETLQEMMNDPDFSDYSEMLRGLLRQKPHTLPAEQEALLAAAGEIFRAPNEIFGMFNNVDVPMPEVTQEDGSKRKLTHGSYGPLIRSKNRQIRKEAFEAMMGAYKDFSATLTAIYSASVKADCFRAKVRHYDSARQASLFPHEIPESVYDNLLSEVDAALPALKEYMEIRKAQLGVDELHLYDLYVPMIGDYDMKMTFPEAFQLVCEGLQPLGEEYIEKLKEGYEGGWIDVYENKAKRSGAYSWGCYGVHPYVLLNHTDDLGGAMTLAHELGHAMHSFHSDREQCYAKAGYSLFVAEVASTCNEVLLMRHLMEKHKDDKKAAAFLCNQLLEEFRTTVFRQTMFAAFEKEAHEMHEKGEALTAQSLSQAYYALNEKYYGGGCQMDQLIDAEWMRIPHFYRNFYVYQYATGFSAAVAIANRILKEGEPAVRDYKKFLSAGGSVPPIEALRYAGVDMEKPDAVRSALSVFADTVKQMKELVK